MELYRIETCGSVRGCPQAVADCREITELIEEVFGEVDFISRRLKQLGGEFKQHQIFRAALAGCPNCCSQPQIKDFALIAKSLPRFEGQKCTSCGRCCEVCRERSLRLESGSLVVQKKLCLGCGECCRVCSQGALTPDRPVWRLQLGGKLGRHPRLAREIGEVNTTQGIKILKEVLNLILADEDPRIRFGDLINKHNDKISTDLY
ncbi:MAG: 4Fe-4S ferredoxin [Peptococcaceae bacterium]